MSRNKAGEAEARLESLKCTWGIMGKNNQADGHTNQMRKVNQKCAQMQPECVLWKSGEDSVSKKFSNTRGKTLSKALAKIGNCV